MTSRPLAGRLLAAIVASLLAACAVMPATDDPSRPPAWTAATALDPALEARIMAIDPQRVSDADVRDALARGPTPRIVLVHGGVPGVELVMQSLANFLVGMGYPAGRIRQADGTYSISPYASAALQAGEIAWYYEHDGGPRPMMIGHSQGGIQAVKILHELAGWLSPEIRVVDPRTDEVQDRTTIVDPLTGQTRPVIGLSFAWISVIGTGGLSLALPHHWNVAARIREVPDNVDSFTGYRLGLDILALDGPGFEGLKTFHPSGRAEVRNVTLPATYSHVFVPSTESLAQDPAARAWINAFRPAGEDVGTEPAEFAGRNIVYAADLWWHVKKHWALEAQRVLAARRKGGAAPPPAAPR